MERDKLSRRDFVKSAIGAVGVSCLNSSIGHLVESGNRESSGVINYFNTKLPIYALTIDDGFYPDVLEKMLDLMKQRSMRATFFLIGNAAFYCDRIKPGIIKRIVEEDHLIGYHSMNHERPEVIKKADHLWWAKDFEKWWNLFKHGLLGNDLANKGLRRIARAPYGLFTNSFLELCDRKGLQGYFWSSELHELNPERSLRKGDMLLSHVTPDDYQIMEATLKKYENGLVASSFDCFKNEDSCQRRVLRRKQFEEERMNRIQNLLKK